MSKIDTDLAARKIKTAISDLRQLRVAMDGGAHAEDWIKRVFGPKPGYYDRLLAMVLTNLDEAVDELEMRP